MSLNPGKDPRGNYSSLFRVVNPELFMKPNLRIGVAGTFLFFGIVGSLLYHKHDYEKQQEKLRNAAKPLELVLNEESG